MDPRYYGLLRHADQEDFYKAVNDPEDELYDIVWDLFEKLIIEPAEIFDEEFRDHNQFRYTISSSTSLEFFPDPDYFKKRIDPNPYESESDAAGIHLEATIHPTKSCLFSVGFRIWGAPERQALKSLWLTHHTLLTRLLERSQPTVQFRKNHGQKIRGDSLRELLNHYFRVKDPENYLAFRYPFAQADDSDAAQNFMVSMACLYRSVRVYCQEKEDVLEANYERLQAFYSGHIPELPPPLPCVEMSIATDAG